MMKFKPFDSFVMNPFHKKIQTIFGSIGLSTRVFKLKASRLINTVGSPILMQIKEEFKQNYEI